MKKLLLVLIAVFLLAGCSSEEVIPKDTNKTIECSTYQDFLKLDIILELNETKREIKMGKLIFDYDMVALLKDEALIPKYDYAGLCNKLDEEMAYATNCTYEVKNKHAYLTMNVVTDKFIESFFLDSNKKVIELTSENIQKAIIGSDDNTTCNVK